MRLVRHPRPLAALLVLLLVPIIVLTSGSGAQAATVAYGPTATAHVAHEGKVYNAVGENIACDLSGHWMLDGTVTSVKGGIACSTGYNIATLFVTLTFSGAGCHDAVADLGTNFDGVSDEVAFLAPGVDAAGTCSYDKVCAHFSADEHIPGAHLDKDDCEQIAIGGPVESTAGDSECTSGVVAPPTESGPINVSAPGAAYGYARDITFTVRGSSTTPGWVLYVVVKSAEGTVSYYPSYTAIGTSTVNGLALQSAAGGLSAPGTKTVRVYTSGTNASDNYSPKPEPGDRIIGAGYYRWTGSHFPDFASSGNISYLQSYDSDDWGLGKAVGITDTSKCRFYYGQKIALTSADDTDEPVGDVNRSDAGPVNGSTDEPPSDVTPPADTASCSFSFSDPSTWAGGGVCQLVKLLGALIDAIGHILDGLVDILTAAFVPDPSKWDFGGLVDQFSNRPPGSLVTATASVVSGVASSYDGSGCGTIADFTSSDTHGPAKITCTQIKNQPGFSGLYTLARVAIWGMAVLALWRIFSNAFTQSEG